MTRRNVPPVVIAVGLLAALLAIGLSACQPSEPTPPASSKPPGASKPPRLSTPSSSPAAADEGIAPGGAVASTGPSTGSAPAAGAERTTLIPAGEEAPDWSLATPDGKTVTLSSLRGKVVVLDFWAVWCVPCKEAMPGIQKLHEKYKDKGVVIYGIDTQELPKNDPAAYMKKNKFTYGLLLHGEKIAPAYGIGPIPVFYVIGVDGKVVLSAVGLENEGQIEPAIEKALKPAGK